MKKNENKGKIYAWIEKYLKKESPEKLARSFGVGIFLAFSPYLGIQTLLVFIAGPLFKLNTAIIFTLVYIVNNPIAILPIILLNYMTGVFVSQKIFGLNLSTYNPSFLAKLNNWLEKKLGYYLSGYINLKKLSIWNYLLGGHIIAIPAGIISYFISKKIFKKIHDNLNK